MYLASDKFNAAILGDDRKFHTKLAFGNTEVTDVVRSIKQYSQVVQGNVFSIGGAVSSYINIELWNPDFQIEGNEFDIYIGLETDSKNIEWCPIGKFTAERPKTSIDGLITVTAYDRIQSKMSGAYFSDLTYPTDAKNVLNEISSKTGVHINTSNLESGVVINKVELSSEDAVGSDGNKTTETKYGNPFDGYTYREALGYIAMLYCKYAVSGRDGSIKFVWFSDSNYTLEPDKYYDDYTTAEVVFKVGTIVCSSTREEFRVGSGVENVRLDNPVMTQDRLNYIYNQVKDLQFIPMNLSFLGDIRVDLGDVITVEKNDGTFYKIPVMNMSQDFDGGLKTFIESYGGSEQENTNKGPTITKLERQYVELFLVKELVGKKANFDYVFALDGEFKTLKADYAEFQNATVLGLQATNAEIENIKSTNITTENLNAALAAIEVLTVGTADLKYATIQNLSALEGSFDALLANAITVENLSANVAGLGYATIDELESKYAKIETLETNYLQIKDLSAETAKLGYATIGQLEATEGRFEQVTADLLDIRLSNIDTANIDKAVIATMFVELGLIDTAVIENGHITGYLDSVSINANAIKAGTLSVDRLVINGTNESLIFALNNAGNLTSTSVNTLDGGLLTDRTITADKIVAHSITANEITTSNIVGSSGWINLAEGTFNYGNQLTWDGHNLHISAESITMVTDGRYASQEEIGNLTTRVDTAEMKLTKDSLVTTIGSYYSTQSDIDNSINNLEIGGRNLILNSRDFTNSIGYNRTTNYVTSLKDNAVPSGCYFSYDIPTRTSTDLKGIYLTYDKTLKSLDVLEEGKTYVISFYAKASVSGITLRGEYIPENQTILSMSDMTVSTEWKRHYVVFKWTRTDVFTITLYTSLPVNQNTTFSISSMKLEKGSKPTDWTPAPEDTQYDIGGRNLHPNGDFSVSDVSSVNYTKPISTYEIVDLEVGNPTGFRKAFHSTSNSSRISFFRYSTLSSGLVGKTVTYQAWVKWSNIVAGSNPSYQTLNIGKLSLTYELADGTTTTTYPTMVKSGLVGTSDWVHLKGTYTFRSDVTALKFEIASGLESVTSGEFWITGIKLEFGNTATDWSPAPEDADAAINSVKAIATQTSTMFNWLVEGNADDKTSLTLTSTMAELITDSLVIKDSTGSRTIISGGTIDLETLFAQNITATNLHITGNSTFDGIISAPTGNIAGFTINDTGLLSSVAKLYSSYSGQGRIELTNAYSNYKLMACDWGLTIDNTAVDSTVSNVYLGFIGSGHVSLQLASKNQTNSESNYVSISTDGSYINLNHTKESYMILSPVVTSTTGEIRANEGYYTGNTSLCENVLTFSHGGGWYMSDATWVRSLNNISIYTGGKIRGDGGLEVNGLGNSGGQVKMLYGDYGVMLRNDGSSFYLLQTAKGDSGGTWNSYRPFYVNLSSGQVGINGSIFQTDMTMIRGGSYALSFRLSSSNNHVFRPTTTAGADADNIVYLGAGASRFHTVYATNGVKSSSDERDKNVFGLDERHKQLLMSLRVISYTWKDDDSKIHVGVSAQQTEKALVSCGFNPDTFGALEHDFWDIPHADGRTDRYSVNYDEIEMLMLPVVQEHEKRLGAIEYYNETQETVINQLLDENALLKKRIEQLENKLTS